MQDERRGSPRQTAYLAGELETTEGKASIAITRDVSAGGLLVLSRRRHEIGAVVSLKMLAGSETVRITGKVVRLEQLEPGESDIWRTKIALAVDDADALAKIVANIPASAR